MAVVFRDAAGKPDAALVRAALAACPLLTDVAERRRDTARAHDLLERSERPEADVALRSGAGADGVPEILAYGRIGEGFFTEGITAEGFKRTLDANPGKLVRVRVNSPGGDAFEGDAIRSVMQAHGNVEVVVDGLAGSAASVIAMGASRGMLKIARNGVVMIHNASTHTGGGVAEHESAIDLLRAVDEGAAHAYAARSGKTVAEMAALMAKTSFLSAQRAKDLGLVDQIIEPIAGAEKVLAMASDGALPEEVVKLLLPVAAPRAHSGAYMDPVEIRKRLGLAADATDAQVFAALDAAAKPATVAPPVAQDVTALVTAAVAAALPAALAAAIPAPAVKTPSEAHAEACAAVVERHIAARKIRPAQRAKAIAACGDDAKSLANADAYWLEAPTVLADGTPPKGSTPNGKPEMSATLKKMMKAGGVSEEHVLAVIAEEES